MPTALTKFAPFRCSDRKSIISMQSSSTFLMKYLVTITSLDARAIAYQEPLVITTQNIDWIPELHNNDSELRAQADGRLDWRIVSSGRRSTASSLNTLCSFLARRHHPLTYNSPGILPLQMISS